MQLIDSHCHFDFDAFAADRLQVWQACRDAGVVRMIIPGVSVTQWTSLAELVATEPRWHAAVGVHPWWVGEQDMPAGQLRRAIGDHVAQNPCVAVGECGLDAGVATPLEQQMAALRPQLEAACELELPLILHVHKTHNEMLRLLKEFRPPRGGVIHAFSGSEQAALDYWSLGFYLGIGGTITYERAAKTRRTVAALPLESLVLESDAPDMPLAGRQGQRNSPANLPLIAAELAKLRGVSVDIIAAQTSHNTENLFSL
ncbi:TatD DNase family protein [Microbulbifer donghaiensis]|uniref:TatD DNase family protein n=1 Tax=Microbulbifer donghaiensis TaxID=494016 RepID=A0A1M5GMJ9_9GAMM|nr:TatD family hydrolase [Microbulbifer donghaiensis]SHG04917.1 TatD DNase family protein [Microbulbifer donghaiensis]